MSSKHIAMYRELRCTMCLAGHAMGSRKPPLDFHLKRSSPPQVKTDLPTTAEGWGSAADMGVTGCFPVQVPKLVVSNLVVCIFYAEALFCPLSRPFAKIPNSCAFLRLRSFNCALLHSFPLFCVFLRLRLERPHLGISDSRVKIITSSPSVIRIIYYAVVPLSPICFFHCLPSLVFHATGSAPDPDIQSFVARYHLCQHKEFTLQESFAQGNCWNQNQNPWNCSELTRPAPPLWHKQRASKKSLIKLFVQLFVWEFAEGQSHSPRNGDQPVKNTPNEIPISAFQPGNLWFCLSQVPVRKRWRITNSFALNSSR